MDALSLSAFRAMIAFGSVELENHCAEVNDLNVFPVPDGDTGSNMSATMSGGVSAINAGKDPDFASLGRAMSEGMLLSARGNSGVILSQFFAGFAKALPAKDTLSIQDFLSCMGAGVRNAYAVVRVPVEGTMLTVMREGHEKAMASSPFKDFESLFIILLKAMEASLEHTPEKLSVLADAGVVDSGGACVGAVLAALKERDGLAGPGAARSERYFCSGRRSDFVTVARDFLGESIDDKTREVDVTDY